MAAAMEVRIRLAVTQLINPLSRGRASTCVSMVQSRCMGFMDKLKFLQKRKDEELAEREEEIVTLEPRDKSQEGQVRTFRKRMLIEEVKSYKPPSNVSKIVHAVARDVYEDVEDDWQNIKLDNRFKKFDFLTKVIEALDHDIPNMDLRNMNTVQDVVKYYNKEVRDSSILEDMTKLDLPKNLHMNQEYIRFHPETDKIHDGVSAFPGIPTHVTSVKFKRKYKGYDGGDPINYPEEFTKRG